MRGVFDARERGRRERDRGEEGERQRKRDSEREVEELLLCSFLQMFHMLPILLWARHTYMRYTLRLGLPASLEG